MANTCKLPAGLFVVQLSNRGNPDRGQDTSLPLPGSGEDLEVAVGSLGEASQACQQYIRKHDLGGGNWAGGEVRRLDGTPVARVAYNGRVFTSDGKDLLLEAAAAAPQESPAE